MYNENPQNSVAKKSLCFLEIALVEAVDVFFNMILNMIGFRCTAEAVEIFVKDLHMDCDKTLSGNHKIKFFLVLIKMLIAVSNGMPGYRWLDKDLAPLS